MLYINFLSEWYEKNRKPCDKCLVKIPCDSHNSCPKWLSYLNKCSILDNISYFSEIAMILSIFILFILFIIITFIFGIWQWFEIINS